MLYITTTQVTCWTSGKNNNLHTRYTIKRTTVMHTGNMHAFTVACVMLIDVLEGYKCTQAWYTIKGQLEAPC